MKARRGQVALLLVVVLVAAIVFTLMNVNVFLAVRAKDRTMNAGDAAALAVAKVQGELLNRIAALNVEHLRAVLARDWTRCDEIVAEQMRLTFLGPLAGIGAANDAAYRNGVTEEASGGMREILLDHVKDIREVFVHNLAFYPEPWSGAWEEYAEALEAQLAQPLYAGPDNVDFVDMRAYFPLFSKAFYHAIAGKMWCWFRGRQELFAYDTNELASLFGGPSAGDRIDRDCCNSEIYPLRVTFASLSSVGGARLVTNLIARLTGKVPRDAERILPRLFAQRFAFYDGHWAKWTTYPGICFNPTSFPIEGDVRSQYNVLGCSATCRVQMDAADVLDERTFAQSEWDHLENRATSDIETKVINWNASAKPFGWLYGLSGEASGDGADAGDEDAAQPVTSWFRLIVPRSTNGDTARGENAASEGRSSLSEDGSLVNAFEDVRLVPVDSVCNGIDASMADRDWVTHVKYHLPTSPYFAGRHRVPLSRYARHTVSCWYCDQLDLWDQAWFRRQGRKWLEWPGNARSCERYEGPGPSATGGTIHAH